MMEYTKRQIIGHIRSLFAERPETVRPTRWACVIKDGKLKVVRRLMVMPADPVILESVLEPDRCPSWFAIYCGVRRNWRKLIAADIKI